MEDHPPDESGLESRILSLETAIKKNRDAKKNLPDCPCWGNAPRLVDAELYSALDRCAAAPAKEKLAGLGVAILKHREDTESTPECTCWITPSRKADVELYAVLAAFPGPDL